MKRIEGTERDRAAFWGEEDAKTGDNLSFLDQLRQNNLKAIKLQKTVCLFFQSSTPWRPRSMADSSSAACIKRQKK